MSQFGNSGYDSAARVNQSAAYLAGATAAPFPPLELENRPTVATDQAAYYLARQQQTLRGWACRENGPLRPLRICGRLAWPTAEIRRLLGVAA